MGGIERRRDPGPVEIGRHEQREVEVPRFEPGDELRVLVHRHVQGRSEDIRPVPGDRLVAGLPPGTNLQLIVQARDDAGADRGHGPDAHRHGLGFPPQSHLGAEALAQTEDLHGPGHDEAAHGRRLRSARCAIEQSGTQRPLQIAQMMVDRRLAPLQLSGGRGDGSGLSDGTQSREAASIERFH